MQPLLLSDVSRRRAILRIRAGRLAFLLSVAAACSAVLLGAAGMVGGSIGWLDRDARSDWLDTSVWLLAMAVVGGGLAPLWDFIDRQLADWRAVEALGDLPEFGALEPQVKCLSNAQLFDEFRARTKTRRRFLVDDVPLYFLVPPGEPFDVSVMATVERYSPAELVEAGARHGIDWTAVALWLTEARRKDRRINHCSEQLRLLAVEAVAGAITIRTGRCNYFDYLTSEMAANLSFHLPAIDSRELLEGPAWRLRELDLDDLHAAGRRYSMAFSVCTVVTTSDGFLVLQRRRSSVTSAKGGVAATATGSVLWEDIPLRSRVTQCVSERPSAPWPLLRSVFRELREETGLTEADLLEPAVAPFMAAAFNLRYGRDLNWYCHLKIRLSAVEVARRFWGTDGDHPGPSHRWEVGHLLFIPVDKLRQDGTFDEPFSGVLGDARHLRGALYALAYLRHSKDVAEGH